MEEEKTMTARVYNGHEWHTVDDPPPSVSGNHRPLPPILNGDGKIFVSLVSFRGMYMCMRI